MSNHPTSTDIPHGHYCIAHDGSKTHTFRVFKEIFLVNASAEFMRDDEYSIGDTIMDVDQGGQAAGATAMPSAAQTGHVGAMRRRKVRVNKAFGRIYQHINDRRIREMLNALPRDDRLARDAWLLVLRMCDTEPTDLNVQEFEREWAQSTIENTVGYQLETITLFVKILNSIDARMPADRKYTEDEMCRKLLACLSRVDQISADAVKELKAAPGSRTFEHPGAAAVPAQGGNPAVPAVPPTRGRQVGNGPGTKSAGYMVREATGRGARKRDRVTMGEQCMDRVVEGKYEWRDAGLRPKRRRDPGKEDSGRPPGRQRTE